MTEDSIEVGNIKDSNAVAIGRDAIAINTTGDVTIYKVTNSAPSIQTSSRVLQLQLASVSAQLERVSSNFSEEIDAKLEEIRELECKGLVQSAQKQTKKLRDSENWEIFTSQLQAKILRMLAGYAITVDDDAITASSLLEQATQLDPEADTKFIQTLICARTNSAKAALVTLQGFDHINLFNLKLALLLETNQADEALSTIQAIPASIQPNTETYRLHALALLIEGSISAAQQKVQQAVAVNPDWETVLEAEAFINYHSALSPAALQKGRFPLPEPVDQAFIKQDNDSLNRLRKAEAAFCKLATETERPDELRQYWRIWQLACLANDPNRQEEAEEFCHTLLEEDCVNTKAIIWAIARNYSIDLIASQRVLEESLEISNDREVIERVTVLLWLYLNDENSQAALHLLEKTREQFEQQNNVNYWLFWHVKALTANRQFEVALQESEALPDTQLHRLLKTSVLREVASKSADWQPVIEHLESCFEETQDGKFLYDCCYLKAYLQDWLYVAVRGEQLLEEIETPAALELAADCAWRAGRFDQLINLVNNNQQLFSNQALPNNLRHLKILCLAELGFLNEAVTEAEALVQEHETANYLATLMSMQFRQGDLHGLVVTARRLLADENTPPINLLQAAKWVQPENTRLAKHLWRQAVKKRLDAESLGVVIDVGYRLSLDEELGPFLQQAFLLSTEESGPFQLASLKEAVSLQLRWREHANKINQHYDRGEGPIHLIAELGRFPLTNIYRNLLQQNATKPNPHNQQSVLARYGGRPVQIQPLSEEFISSCSQWRLNLDISAFLLADYLGLLTSLEQHFKPLRISANFQAALIHERQMLLSHQPSRLALYQQVLSLLKIGKLRETPRQLDISITLNKELTERLGKYWLALLDKAKVEGGYLVETLPLRAWVSEYELQPVLLSAEDQERVINCRALLEALKQNQLVTDSQYQTALQGLGDEGYLDSLTCHPQLNTPIFLMGGTTSILAEAKILNKICDHFQVFVDYKHIDDANNAISAAQQRSQLVEEITELIERVRDGLENRDYELIQLSNNRNDQEPEIDGHPVFLTAFDLFKFEPQMNDVVWIDDRFFNRHSHRSGVPIITIVEVLDALLARGEVSRESYYDKLLHLRKANVRYIPVTNEEITYWLRQSQTVKGVVKETPELVVLRQYLASCLLDTHRLHLPPIPENSPNSQGEVPFLLNCLRAAEDAIVAGWLDKSVGDDQAVAYANWILTNLHTGIFGIHHLISALDSDSNGIDLISLDISSLYIRGIPLWRDGENSTRRKNSPRQHYFKWLDWRITEPRFKANSEVAAVAAQSIYASIAEQSKVSQEDEFQDRVARYIYQQFYSDLPDELRTKIKSNLELMNWFGTQTIPSIRIDTLSLPAKEFWHAAEEIINSRENTATITALEPHVRVDIQRNIDNRSRNILEIKSEDGSISQGVDDALFQILSNDQDQIANVLRSQRFWLDCNHEKLEQIISEITSIQEPRTRFEQTKAWRDQSAAFFYRKLELGLAQAEEFNLSELTPPSAEGLVRYFRLTAVVSSSGAFHVELSQSAWSLITQEGIEEALNRLTCLPVKLPSVVVEELSRLTPQNRQALFQKLADTWASPICKLHLVDLALSFPQDEESELLKHLLDEIYTDAAVSHFNLFSLLLQLVDNAFSFRSDIQEWPATIRLAMTWAHASKLQNFLDVPGLKLQDFIDSLWVLVQNQVNSDRLNRNLEFWNDVLHPRRFDRIVLAVHGLAFLLQDKSPEVLNQNGVIEYIQEFAVQAIDEHRVPNPQLFRDPVLAKDSLGSILGGDRGQCLTSILGVEIAQYLESGSLKSIVDGAIQNLKSDSTVLTQWSWLNVIVGDLAVYEDLREPLEKVLEALNINVLFNIDSNLAFLAMDFSSAQSIYIGDEKIQLHLETQLLALAELLAKQDEQEIDTDVVAQLIEIIFKVSIKPKKSQDTSRSASELLIKTLNIWPKLADTHIYNGLFKLIQELPIEQLHGFWKGFLYLRALRNQQKLIEN